MSNGNDNSPKYFCFYNRLSYCNINITVEDGNLSYVASWGTSEDLTHDLKKHPNWEYVETLFTSIGKANPDEFKKITQLLDKKSKGYKIIKDLKQQQIDKCNSEIYNLEKELEFWKNV
jgi:hypothetical protein